MMKKFLSKYRIQIQVIAIILLTVLAIIKWIQFSETGNNRVNAIIWSILAISNFLNLLVMKRDKKLAEQGSLNNNSNSSAE